MSANWRIVLALVVTTVLVAVCSGTNSRPSTASVRPRQSLLDPIMSAGSATASAFAPIAKAGEGAVCSSFLPPRLVTRGGSPGGNGTFSVDLVIGADGSVESVLILDAATPGAESKIADRVARWVYKPASCNGVPVASEGRIEVRGE